MALPGVCKHGKEPILRPFINIMQASCDRMNARRTTIRTILDSLCAFIRRKMSAARSICWLVFVSLQIVFYCAFLSSNLHFYREVKDHSLTAMSKDEVMAYGDRFDELQKHLPDDVKIGCFTDRRLKEYYFSQYHLAPHLLMLDRRLGYILENLHSGESPSPISASPEYRLIYSDGNGVRLFRKEHM